MRFHLATDLPGLAAYLPNFLALAGGDRWKRRAIQLSRDAMASPSLAKIIADYHWLELALSEQMMTKEGLGRLLPERLDVRTLAALHFAGMVVEVYGRLSPIGRTALKGRIHHALKAETGFASLYLEMDVALRLLGEGFDVEFPELEAVGQYDLGFAQGSVVGEVECKSLSADAGRKIHRKDFYRFIHAAEREIAEWITSGRNEVLVITLEDRLPGDTAGQSALRAAVARMFAQRDVNRIEGEFFTVVREDYASNLGVAPRTSERNFYKACCDAYGKDCHVSGALTADGGCLVVMRSRREDDHSRPQAGAIKKAASQLSGTRPGFIAVQYEEIEPADLTRPHLRRRAALLANCVFHRQQARHVAGVYFCAFAGLHVSDGIVGAPAFICSNPRFMLSPDGLPFRIGVLRNSEFARVLGVNPADTDPDDHVYGLSV